MAHIKQESDFDLQIPDDWFDLPEPDAKGPTEADEGTNMQANPGKPTSMSSMGLHGLNSIRSDDAPPQPHLSEQPPESGPLAGDGTRNSPVSSLPSHTPPAHTRRLFVSPLDGAETEPHVAETSDDEVEIVAYYPTKRKRKNTRTMVSDEDEHTLSSLMYVPPYVRSFHASRISQLLAPAGFNHP
ncbi:hypothetical protein FOMPIDRAFT_1056355 [Fomitopsis schrenkii]|uniref:Uncharacterized protein n=1 Tax=Fomitopsis schrenkii TaxID=2126942 RepID=S8DHJ3_FOMSC|nr:hypothetical protein FOMPIDRAFT_1056355 [Fomitopsis schrenkii]